MMSVRGLVSPLSGSSEYLSRKALGLTPIIRYRDDPAISGKPCRHGQSSLIAARGTTSPCRRSLRAIMS